MKRNLKKIHIEYFLINNDLINAQICFFDYEFKRVKKKLKIPENQKKMYMRKLQLNF